MATPTTTTGSHQPTNPSSMANPQLDEGGSGSNTNDVPQTHSLATCSLNQAFVLSAPTPARLSEILECWFQTPGDEYDLFWGILDPLLEEGFGDSEERHTHHYQRVLNLIRTRWPTSFGHFERDSDGTPSGFRWDDTYPELLRAVFYPLVPHDQPKRRIMLGGPAKTGRPYRPGTSFAESTTVPGTPHRFGLEPAAHGRIWYDFHGTYSNRY